MFFRVPGGGPKKKNVQTRLLKATKQIQKSDYFVSNAYKYLTTGTGMVFPTVSVGKSTQNFHVSKSTDTMVLKYSK